jgi:hypothetical protein
MTPDTTDNTRQEPVPWDTIIEALAESNARALQAQREIQLLRQTLLVAIALALTTIYMYERTT